MLRLTNVRAVRPRGGWNKDAGEKAEFELGPPDDDIWIQDGTFVDGERKFWQVSSEREFYHGEPQVIDCANLIASPGFIDVQINGAFGIDFTSEHLTEEDVAKVARGILAHGVTSFCPTIVTSPPEFYSTVLPRMCRKKLDDGAEIMGLHLEGPFISADKKGAHRPEFVRSVCDLDVYGTHHLDRVDIVTVAPELDNATECIRKLSRRGIIVSIGHTMADYAVAKNAVKEGARCITHLFNAHSTFHHRDPGLMGLLGTPKIRSSMHYGIIPDGTQPCCVSFHCLSVPSERRVFGHRCNVRSRATRGELRAGQHECERGARIGWKRYARGPYGDADTRG